MRLKADGVRAALFPTLYLMKSLISDAIVVTIAQPINVSDYEYAAAEPQKGFVRIVRRALFDLQRCCRDVGAHVTTVGLLDALLHPRRELLLSDQPRSGKRIASFTTPERNQPDQDYLALSRWLHESFTF